MRGAIVGAGTIAMGHLAGYRLLDDLSIVAVVDTSAARRRHAQESLGLPAYADIAELMARHEIDFLDVCTPPDTHGPYSALGLSLGLHVLCEKPVFLPAEPGFPDLIREIQASDRIFYPCHVYKFAPILHAMKDITRAPGFGRPLRASFQTLRKGHARGVPDWRPDWRREREFALGGILRDHGPHSIYLAMDLTERTPVSVSCLMGNLRSGAYPDTEDTVLLRLRCDDDVDVSLTLSWAAGHRSTTYSIVGESGFVNVDGDDLTYSIDRQVVRKSIESKFDDPSHQDWFVHMLQDFGKAASNPGQQNPIIREALVTAYVMEAAYESAARDGAWTDVEIPGGLLPA